MANVPIHSERISKDLFVEPLGGPEHIEILLETFPETIYDKSPSSKFYKFFYALVGPSGIGQLVRNYFEARLVFLEHNVELFNIEKFYGDPFQFGRIFEEQTYADIDTSLLPENWEKVKAQDASYRSRALDFVGAARLGNSVQGMKLAAQSGLGSEVAIFERYKWIFDQISDQPIGVKNYGRTFSLNEFTVIPRPLSGKNEVQELRFEATVASGEYSLDFQGHRTPFIPWNADAIQVQTALRDLPNIEDNGVIVTGGPAPFPFVINFTGPLDNVNVEQIKVQSSTLADSNGKSSNVKVITTSEGARPIDQNSNVPQRLLHNMESSLDRLKPVNSMFTFESAKGSILNKTFTASASSHYIEPIRFVTGNPQINWPPVDDKFWIESGLEKTAKRFYQDDSAHYIAFHPISSIAVEDQGLTNGEEMIDPSSDVKYLSNNYVNGIYPVEYSAISGATNIPIQEARAERYWESISRTYPENEIIEIDLGSAKPTNFIAFNINNIFAKVRLEYCVWSNGSEKHFEEVLPSDSEFSSFIEEYDQTNWSYIECQFTDSNEAVPITQYIKIIVERLNDSPYNKDVAVKIKSLKVGRNTVL